MPNGLFFWMPLEHWTAQPFKYCTNGCHLVFYVLVWYSNGQSSTLTQPDHMNTKLYSNVSSIQMVGIQIPTVLTKCKEDIWIEK